MVYGYWIGSFILFQTVADEHNPIFRDYIARLKDQEYINQMEIGSIFEETVMENESIILAFMSHGTVIMRD